MSVSLWETVPLYFNLTPACFLNCCNVTDSQCLHEKPRQETVKKTLVNEAKRIEILELMIEHGDDYDPKTEAAFFDKIAGLVNTKPGFEGLTGPNIKTRVHNSATCKERRAPGPKRDADSELERTADRWVAITSRYGDANAGSVEVKRLDDRTVESLVKASAGTIEAKRGVLSSPDSSRKDWQQAEVVVGLPLVMSTTPEFLTGKQIDAIIRHNRNSAALVRASHASGQGQGQGTGKGITAAIQKTTVTHPQGGVGNGGGPSKPRAAQAPAAKPWTKNPVVVDLRTPPPPSLRSSDGKPNSNPNPNKRQSRATREKTEDIHRRAHEETVEMARIVANMKREAVEEDEGVDVNIPSHDETTKKSRKHSAMEEAADDEKSTSGKKKLRRNKKKRSE